MEAATVADRKWMANCLAAAFLRGGWATRGMEATALEAMGIEESPQWLLNLIAEILRRIRTPYAPTHEKLTRVILDTMALHALVYGGAEEDEEFELPQIEILEIPFPDFSPLPPFRDLAIRKMDTLEDLATWLNLPMPHIEWLADIEGYRASATSESTRHYRQIWKPKRMGPPRLIEAPKQLLKGIQRKILDEILAHVPLHDGAHGFRKGRSCIGAAQLHAGEEMVFTVDLKDFFPGIPARSVHGLFRCLGYPPVVARYLTGLCSTVTPSEVFERLQPGNGYGWAARQPWLQPHLPQGAPTSPALANLCAYRLDCRLEGLARRFGARYTRYGDDLAFSGDVDFAARAGGFLRTVGAICNDCGQPLNHRKTRIMHKGGRQSVTGLTVNSHVNVPRDAYDRLKAILYNCVRHGPAGQNHNNHPDFRAHLDGRVTWVETVNLHRGTRLRALFERIEWG